jgi:alpha-glucosidase (family GH31 glycosyl hydrolase)
MMGDDYMAAPVLNLGQRSRNVYFPSGADWVHHYSGQKFAGGTTANVSAPLATFPLFKRTNPTPSSLGLLVAEE